MRLTATIMNVCTRTRPDTECSLTNVKTWWRTACVCNSKEEKTNELNSKDALLTQLLSDID